MEQHLEDLARAQKGKLAISQRRAMELNDLRPPQGNQMIEPMEEGQMMSGGEAGLRRVVGGRLKKHTKMTGGAYTDSQFGVINEPYSNQMEGGAKYGQMLGEHLVRTKGGAFGMDFGKSLMSSVEKALSQSKAPLAPAMLKKIKKAKGGRAPAGGGIISDLNIPVVSGIAKLFGLGATGATGGMMCRRCGMMDCECGSVDGSGTKKGMTRKTARKAFESGMTTGSARPTGGKRTLPPALRKRADAIKRLTREEGMTFKEAIEYLKKHPLQ